MVSQNIKYNGGGIAPKNLTQGVATMATSKVNFLSYNSTGISQAKCSWIRELCSLLDIHYLSIQEHFRNSKTTDKYFCDEFQAYNSYVIPGFRPTGQDSGRPKGGIAQLSDKCLAVKKDRIVTKNFRIQAQVLNFPSSRLLWINSYLPNDPLTANYDDTELIAVLAEIEHIMDNTAFDDLIWNGDLNWDLSRRTGYSATMDSFMKRIGLIPVWERHPVDFTHLHTDLKSTSTLDHFIVNERLLPLIQADVVHLGDNLSRHSPIMLKLDIGAIPKKEKVRIKSYKRPVWYKATQVDTDNYSKEIQYRLEKLKVPTSISCSDPHCQDPIHSSERDNLLLDILCGVIEASHTSIPMTSGRARAGSRRECRPGWSESVEPFRTDSLFWHGVWRSAGKPNTGPLYFFMTKSRSQYHYAVRRVKQKEKLIRATKLFEASVTGEVDLLKEMKNIKVGGNSTADLPENVAGANGEDEVVEKFRQVYSALYSSSDSSAEMTRIKAKIRDLISHDSVEEVFKITGETVKKAAKLMKKGKADVSQSFTTDAILNAPDILFEHLAAIYRSWLIHGTVTGHLLACAFLPLLKSSLKDPADTNSYRAIAGSSIILKLFDKVVLVVWGQFLSSDSLQFGYKAETSTTQCSWLVMEVANHFLRNGSHPILTLLDCTKAFDTCKFDVLFQKLLDKNLPPIVVRTLAVVYQEQYAWVRWGNSRSARFPILNGTRQGSVLSPALFSVYMDDLLLELRALGVGCYVGGVYVGAVGFADDILLLAPSRCAMEVMLAKCEGFAEKKQSQVFNRSKSK